MIRYLLSRLAQSLVTLVLASIVVFAGVRALPGDPALAAAGEEATPEAVAAVRAELGLDQALWVQYGKFVGRLLHGDLGTSIRTGTPVTSLIGTTLPVTLWLAIYALVIAVVFGVALGVVAAVRRGRWQELAVNAISLVGLSVPTFWLGLLAILYLAVELSWFPASGYVPMLEDPLRSIHHLTLPAVILGITLAAVVMRQTRASMIGNLSSDYVRTARAKGASAATVVLRFALRNSLVVVVTLIGLQLGGMVAGVAVTERIFGLPGFGKLTLDSVSSRDYPVIEGVVLIVTLAYILINFAVDIAYSILDPRIRVTGGSR